MLLIINNLHRELVVHGRVSTFVLDNDVLLQKLVYKGVAEDCVCSCSTEISIYSCFKHMQMKEKIPD